MSRCLATLAVLFLASWTQAQELAKDGARARSDPYGDPLPAGALRRLGTVRFRQQYVHDMAYLPDGHSLIVQGAGRVAQWDVATGKPLRIIPTSPLGNYRSLGLSRDGSLLAYRPDNDNIVYLNVGQLPHDSHPHCHVGFDVAPWAQRSQRLLTEPAVSRWLRLHAGVGHCRLG